MSKYIVPNKYNGEFIDGRSRYNGKGGGGGGQNYREATAEEKRLWGAQAKSLEQMNAISMPTLRTGMNNLGVLANESMDGTFGNRLRSMASADANQSLSTGLQAATRGLDRFGSTLNPNAMGKQMNDAALQGATVRSDAMNKANIAAEDTKWNRNAALTGLASGQGATAINGMGSLAGQIGSSRNAENSFGMQQQQANATALSGLGMGAAYMMKKDGGEIRMANGGGLQMFNPVSMPRNNPWKFSAETIKPQDENSSLAGAVSTGMMADKFLNDGEGMKAIRGIVSKAREEAKQALKPDSAPITGNPTGTVEDAPVISSGDPIQASELTTGLNPPSVTASASDFMAAAPVAGTDAALGTLGSGALGASIPEAGLAAALPVATSVAEAAVPEWLSLLLLKDGGPARKDMTPGGKVKGPGTATSDSVRARLSNGEFVENTDAVNLPREESEEVVENWLQSNGSTKELLNDINNAGLGKRGKPPVEVEGGEQKLALGGLAMALGNMARGYVPTAVDLDQKAKDEAFRQEQLGLQRAAENRAQTQFQDQQDIVKLEKGIRDKYANAKPVELFNSDTGVFGTGKWKGTDADITDMGNGKTRLTFYERGTNNPVGYEDHDTAAIPKMGQQALQASMLGELAAVNPHQYLGAALQHGVTMEQLSELRKQHEWQRGHGDEQLSVTRRGQDIQEKQGKAQLGLGYAQLASSERIHNAQLEMQRLIRGNELATKGNETLKRMAENHSNFFEDKPGVKGVISGEKELNKARAQRFSEFVGVNAGNDTIPIGDKKYTVSQLAANPQAQTYVQQYLDNRAKLFNAMEVMEQRLGKPILMSGIKEVRKVRDDDNQLFKANGMKLEDALKQGTLWDDRILEMNNGVKVPLYLFRDRPDILQSLVDADYMGTDVKGLPNQTPSTQSSLADSVTTPQSGNKYLRPGGGMEQIPLPAIKSSLQYGLIGRPMFAPKQ